MRKYSSLIAFHILILVLTATMPRAQNVSVTRELSVDRIRMVPADSSVSQRFFLRLDNGVCNSETGMLPLVQLQFELAEGIDSLVSAEFIEPEITSLPDMVPGNIIDGQKAGQDFMVFSSAVITRHERTVTAWVLPVRISSSGNGFEQLTRCTLRLEFAGRGVSPAKSAAGYVPHSVLSSGKWLRMATTHQGIHKITYDELKSAGIDPAGIDPRNIRIYGNGGGMLPEANATPRIDDLLENRIFVSGESDGKFDQGDYILFVGQSADKWHWVANENRFRHRKNVYADKVFFFLTADLGPGLRVINEPSVSLPATGMADRFNDFAFYERDEVNLIKSGRQWWDRQYFDLTTTRDYSFSFPDIDASKPVNVLAHVAARSTGGATSFTISAQGDPLFNISLPAISGSFEDNFAQEKTGSAGFNPTQPDISIRLAYNKSNSSSVGYLNYIALNATRMLKMNSSQMSFRDITTVGSGNITEFRLSTPNSQPVVWDITRGDNVRQIQTSASSGQVAFRLPTDTLREFIAFDGQAFFPPEFQGIIANQDLHGMEVPDYVMVTHPDFLTEAERLAQFHRTNGGLNVAIVTPDQVYNEFSSGAQDVTAIRDFMRMLYNRAEPGKEPKYLLLFGDASYDYKNRTQDNTNFVPIYQSTESLSPISSFVSDDFFGMMDANEGQSANGTADIGVGRFPVFSEADARRSVDKVLHYCYPAETVMNDWRNVVTMVADDQNEGGNLFVEDAEDLSAIIEKNYRDYNVDKIYSDAFTMLSTPGGGRYPEVNETISKRVEKGSLLVNYVGHGGELGWGHERILEVQDIRSWQNMNNMPVFVTATCEFSRVDDPGRVSAGEWVFLNPNGGGVALFTTTRLTFAGTNKSLLVNFYNNVFKKSGGKYMKLGELLMAAKKNMGSSPNIHSFVLLGDPAMQMAYPDLNIVTTSITSSNSTGVPDTLKALAEVTISGEIHDVSGSIASDFNGTLFPTIFDKATESWTKANQANGSPVKFYLQKNPVYKGKVEVVNGAFTFSFIVPKDIAIKYGAGKISYYARSAGQDANGYSEIIIGGYNDQAQPDDQGPELSLYMNDKSFRSGGITNQSPMLLAYVSDTAGVNTVGNGIGHDLVAILDNKSSTPIILNDYYVSDLNTFKSGVVNYPLSNLADGLHTISVRVWDVYNNSTSASIEFLVVSSSEMVLDRLYNYPNPMTDHTTFAWETNQVNQPLEAEISIFTLNGDLIRILKSEFYETGFRNTTMTWDGTRSHGGKVSAGTYVYRLKLTIPDGTAHYKTSKIVVLR